MAGVPEIFVREESGPGRGRTHALALGRALVGRDPGATVSLAGDDVSRFHAALDVTAESIAVTDLGSKNGVFRDGVLLSGTTGLAHGEAIVVGGICLRVHHPGAQVDAALRRGGEATVTQIRPARAAERGESLLVPVAATLMFAALVAALLLWQQ
ncbi:FHA domain-containing protein [Nannocystis radixulma]|uniref:FHA domain-containing protein n=1 Tax=Nannocystis radixulma TaxID=2995305 RepID=A0ABT5AW76_9BACT|nr:FHA domain-containing protein [Nannocystis radixulma]MDC0666091.1 FHA domain-containing protein [Nannocystis radixulma]